MGALRIDRLRVLRVEPSARDPRLQLVGGQRGHQRVGGHKMRRCQWRRNAVRRKHGHKGFADPERRESLSHFEIRRHREGPNGLLEVVRVFGREHPQGMLDPVSELGKHGRGHVGGYLRDEEDADTLRPDEANRLLDLR